MDLLRKAYGQLMSETPAETESSERVEAFVPPPPDPMKDEEFWKDYQVDPFYRSHELWYLGSVYHHPLKREGEGFAGAGQPRIIGGNKNSTFEPPDWPSYEERFFNGLVGWGRRCSATVMEEGGGEYRFFTNLRLRLQLRGDVQRFLNSSTSLFELIEHAELDVGGQRFDRLQWWELRFEAARLGKLCSIVQDTRDELVVELPLLFDLVTAPKFFSGLECHSTRLGVEFSRKPFEGLELEDAMILIDIVDLPDANPDFACWKEPGFHAAADGLLMLQSQFTGEETFFAGASWGKLRLNFNHPLLYLGLAFKFGGKLIPEEWCRKVFTSLAIDCNGKEWNSWKSEELLCIGGVLLIPLMEDRYNADLDPRGVVLNASQIDNLTMRIAFNPEIKKHLSSKYRTVTTESAPWLEEPTVEERSGSNTCIQVLLTARNYQNVRVMSGMAGLTYSK